MQAVKTLRFVAHTGSALLLCAVALLLTACGAARTATPAPTLTPIPPTGTPVPQARDYTILDTDSTLTYVSTLQLGGATMDGGFRTKGQTLTAIPQQSGYLLKLDLVIDGNSVTGANDLVVSALKGNLEVDKFPYGRFLATTADTLSLEPGKSARTILKGTLELHGVQRPFELPVTITADADGAHRLMISGATSIDLLDYKVFVPTALLKSVISFSAKITAAEAPAPTGVP